MKPSKNLLFFAKWMVADVSFPDNMASIRQFFDRTRPRIEMKNSGFIVEEGGKPESLVNNYFRIK